MIEILNSITASFLGWVILSFLFCAVVMTITFWIAKKMNYFCIVDIVWAFTFLLLNILYVLCIEGSFSHKALLLGSVCLWSLRLSSFLFFRIKSHYPVEDGRYLELRKKYGKKVYSEFFWFFQMQGVSVVLLSLPFLLIAFNTSENLKTIEWMGFALFHIGWLGESLADFQMNRFKQNPLNKGKVCNIGLWNFSRHPNYFFESVLWFGFFGMALGSNYGTLMIYCPLVMLYLLLKVTGVPLSELQSLKTRGDAYRLYQSKTSIFIPWFKKK